MDPYSWSWNAEALVVLGLTAAYLLAIRGTHAPAWRVACFLGAMLMLLAVSVTPIHTLGMHYLLTMHLLQNVVLAEWAPLLVVLAIPAALAAAIAGHGAVRTITYPAVALPLWLANYMVWHLPWIYNRPSRTRARSSTSSTRCTSTLDSPCGGVSSRRATTSGSGARAAYVFAAFVLASPIGLVLALIPSAIYGFYVEAHHRVWGLDPLADQQLAGMLMAAEQAVVFFAVFAYWFFRFLLEEERRADVDHPPAHA